LTPSIYLVWYKNNKTSSEKAAGFAYQWSHAEQMCEGLFAIKRKIDKSADVIVGISQLECGDLYTTKQPKQKWQIFPILVVLTGTGIKD